jgi:hypothetical protein
VKVLVGVVALVMCAGLVSGSVVQAAPARTAAGIAHHGTGGHHGISWHERDRAVYAVSTLNAPLCGNGQQLSTVLWNAEGSRIFDVSRATTIRNTYFIQVRTVNLSLVGVYAYKFGSKLPTGVTSAKCVAPASSGVVAAYASHQWRFEVRFTSTYPQS